MAKVKWLGECFGHSHESSPSGRRYQFNNQTYTEIEDRDIEYFSKKDSFEVIVSTVEKIAKPKVRKFIEETKAEKKKQKQKKKTSKGRGGRHPHGGER